MCRHRIARVVVSLVVAAAARANHGPDPQTEPRNGLSEDRKCWQRVELGIHDLKRWGRNRYRKVRETRSSSSRKRSERGQEALAAR